jgi:hypothetical protein
MHFAKLLEDRGEYNTSLLLYREIFEVRRKIFGEEHWLTLSTLRRVTFVEQLISDDAAYAESGDDLERRRAIIR